MAGTAVVAMRFADDHVPAVADSVRALLADEWSVVLVSSGDAAPAAALAIGATRAGRRAVPVVTHTLVDPADPAFAHPGGAADPEPLAVLEAEAIAALLRSGFPVVVADQLTVVPSGDVYESVAADVDAAAAAQRLAGDLGASALVFVVGDDAARLADIGVAGEIDVVEAERRMAADARFAAEFRAAVRFLRAGGELAVVTTPSQVLAALEQPGDGLRTVRIHRRLSRPRSGAPALAAGWI